MGRLFLCQPAFPTVTAHWAQDAAWSFAPVPVTDLLGRSLRVLICVRKSKNTRCLLHLPRRLNKLSEEVSLEQGASKLALSKPLCSHHHLFQTTHLVDAETEAWGGCILGRERKGKGVVGGGPLLRQELVGELYLSFWKDD